MSDTIMELDLVVGSLITIQPDEDREAFEEEQEEIAAINDQLREEGIVFDLLAQPGTQVWEGGIETMGALYQLSRLATYLEKGESIEQVLEDGPVIYEDLDRAVTDVWDDMTQTRFAHLVNLQGIYSHYLPVDFAAPVWLPFEDEESSEDERFFGSSVRLQQELTTLDEMLRSAGVAVQSEAYRCLEVLHEAATQSIRYGLPVIIW